MHLRRRAAVLATGASVLFVIGTNVQAGWLFVIAAFLLGAVIAGAALPSRMVRGIDVARTVPARVHQGDLVPVELQVTNRSRGMRASLFVHDPFLADADVFIPHLAPGERVELVTLREASRRGPQGADAVILRSDAPFAVAERRRRLEAAGRVIVLPRIEELGELSFVDRAPTRERGIRTQPRRGIGPEYLGIREYRPGDSMRHVHWPSTARHGSVMVREFEEETTRRLAIVVDTLTDVGEAWTALDAACSAAASVALAAAAHGQGVRLVTVGAPGTREAGRPNVLSRPREDELLMYLAEVGPSGWDLATTVDRLDGVLRGMESALAIAPTWRANAADSVVPAVDVLLAEVGRVAVLLVDAASWGAPPAACLPEPQIALLVSALARAGAEPYRWERGRELSAALEPAAVGV